MTGDIRCIKNLDRNSEEYFSETLVLFLPLEGGVKKFADVRANRLCGVLALSNPCDSPEPMWCLEWLL